jgi:hypothetical protein
MTTYCIIWMTFDGSMAFESALTVSGEGAGLTAGSMVMHHLDGLSWPDGVCHITTADCVR